MDYGERRVGLAVSDPGGIIASPSGVRQIKSLEQALAAVLDAARELEAGEFVVGIPYNMNGSLGEMGEKAGEFAEKLEARSGLPVHRWDERLTTIQAERALQQGRLTRKKRKARRDSLAAQILLQSFLDARRSRE